MDWWYVLFKKIRNYYNSHRELCITLIILLAAYLIRVIIIFNFQRLGIGYSHDLQNYYGVSQFALNGENPYKLYKFGESGEWVADILPLEVLFWSMLLFSTHNYLQVVPHVIRIDTQIPLMIVQQIYFIFAFIDVLNIYFLGIIFQGSKLRRYFQFFYAFNPLTIFMFTIMGEDKNVLFLLLLIIIYLIKKTAKDSNFKKKLLVIFSAGALASFKWIGLFPSIPLIYHYSNNIKDRVLLFLSFSGIFILSHVPWFPYTLYIYQSRATYHLGGAGQQSLLTLIPNNLLIYAKYLYFILIISSLLIVYILHIFNKININEAVILSIFGFMIWAPNLSGDHIALISISLMLIIDWAKNFTRIIVTWILGAFVGISMIGYNGGFAMSHPKITSILLSIYGSGAKQTILYQVLIVFLLIIYIYDRIHLKSKCLESKQI